MAKVSRAVDFEIHSCSSMAARRKLKENGCCFLVLAVRAVNAGILGIAGVAGVAGTAGTAVAAVIAVVWLVVVVALVFQFLVCWDRVTFRSWGSRIFPWDPVRRVRLTADFLSCPSP